MNVPPSSERGLRVRLASAIASASIRARRRSGVARAGARGAGRHRGAPHWAVVPSVPGVGRPGSIVARPAAANLSVFGCGCSAGRAGVWGRRSVPWTEMNPAWHRAHVLGRKATRQERITWHREHARACGCRPPPASLAADLGTPSEKAPSEKQVALKRASKPASKRVAKQGMSRTRVPRAATRKATQTPAASRRTGAGSAAAPSTPATVDASTERAFAKVVDALRSEPGVTYGGKGFGSRALKLDGRLFAMLSARSQFVVKLPRERVAQLIDSGQGTPFETGRDRVMREWVAIAARPSAWVRWAREALRFVRGAE